MGSAVSWDLAGKKRSSRSASSPEVTGIWRKVVTVASDNVTAHALDIADAAVTGRLMISPAEPKLEAHAGRPGCCEMWNTAAGPEKRVDYYMWAKAYTENGIAQTSLSRENRHQKI